MDLRTRIADRVIPGGWVLNGDIVVDPDPGRKALFQQMRVLGIVARAAGVDDRFRDGASVRQYLDMMEQDDGDQPRTLDEDLQSITMAGLRNPTVFWRETREVVLGGTTFRDA